MVHTDADALHRANEMGIDALVDWENRKIKGPHMGSP